MVYCAVLCVLIMWVGVCGHSRIHTGGESGNRSSAPDPPSARSAWPHSSAAPDPTRHHTGDHQQVNVHAFSPI